MRRASSSAKFIAFFRESKVDGVDSVLRHQPEFLPDFLKLRPTNHNEDFWNAIKPAVAVKLVPLARKFNSDAAKEALRKAGRSLACAQTPTQIANESAQDRFVAA